MKKIIFCLTAVLMLAACNNKSENQDNNTAGSDETTRSEMPVAEPGDEGQTEWIKQTTIMTSKPMVIDFFATWCGPCKMMHPVLVQLKDELGDSIRIIKIDVDKNESLSMTHRIQSVPTLMLFRKGEVLWRQSGALSLSDLKASIAKFQ